ncbi:hypothetical protein [Butyrivibrio sp. XPD2006]|nr:hypothetical protein [Butyrivibrio sp. XPD2006]
MGKMDEKEKSGVKDSLSGAPQGVIDQYSREGRNLLWSESRI